MVFGGRLKNEYLAPGHQIRREGVPRAILKGFGGLVRVRIRIRGRIGDLRPDKLSDFRLRNRLIWGQTDPATPKFGKNQEK